MSSIIVAALSLTTAAMSGPASAQVGRFDPALDSATAPMLTQVQFHGGFHGGGVRRFQHGGGFRHGGFGGHGGFRHGHHGFGIGAGVAGLAAGALIGGAIASQAAPAYGYGYDDTGYVDGPPPAVEGGDAEAYCAQRFKSYDPSSGTYLGYDGQRHPCP